MRTDALPRSCRSTLPPSSTGNCAAATAGSSTARPCSSTPQHAYAELRRGLPALVDGWSVWTPGKPNGRPWDGMSDRERLVWMVKVQADPWWPSAAKRDARWEEMHGAERERMQNHRQRVSRSSHSRVDAG